MTIQTANSTVVKIQSVRWFTQWNRFTRMRESKAAITMVPADGGNMMVTFTNSCFAENVNDGDVVAIECKYKGDGEYNGEPQSIVTHCRLVKRISRA